MPPISAPFTFVPVSATSCRVVFGAPAATITHASAERTLNIALPVLAGDGLEVLMEAVEYDTLREGCVMLHGGGRTVGLAVARAGLDLEAAASDLYQRILAATDSLRLYRIWNYVPQINAVTEGLENYRRFCRGRSLAFENHFGSTFRNQLPAASAVGAIEGPLGVAFLAGEAAVHHFENPKQVPAFEYPPAYGPRAPSFSRATLVGEESQRELFISGTAAIRGHATIGNGDLDAQLACTRENLDVIAVAAGAGTRFGADDGWQRMFKVYLRHPSDFTRVRADLEKHLLADGDEVSYLQADLCRADLLVEVEAVLSKKN